MEVEMELEDLAMGKLPEKKVKKEVVSAKTKGTIDKINGIIMMLEEGSISSYKKLSSADRKALKHMLHELNEACYSAKSLIREATPEEEKKSRGMLGVALSSEEEY